MAITAKGKLNEMINNGKADPSIEIEYNELETKYKASRREYIEAKEDLKEDEESLEIMQQEFKNAPIFSDSRAILKKQIGDLDKKMRPKRRIYSEKRQEYLQDLKALADLKRTIRVQYRACKAYERFFAQIKEAEELGIDIPRNIKAEVARHKMTYQIVRFSNYEEGRIEIAMPHIESAIQLGNLIRRERAIRRRQTVEGMIENAKIMVRKTIDMDR